MTDVSPVPGGSPGESAQDRLDRLIDDAIAAGNLTAIRQSINLAAGLPADHGVTDVGIWNDALLIQSGDRNQIRSRLEAIFTNRGVPIEVPGTVAKAPDAPPSDSAMAQINQTLADYGLESLSEWAMGLLKEGRSSDHILQELRNRPEFQQRFPAIAARRSAGLTPLSPAEYVAYEQQARQILHQFGLPEGFYDKPADFTNLLTADVSVAELYERVQRGYAQVANAAPEVRAVFADYFGVNGDSALAAWFLDPDRATPDLLNMGREAEIGGAARQQQLALNLAEARRLRERGITGEQAREGFGQVRQLDPIFEETVGERGVDFTAEREGISAVFGLDATDARRIERRRAQRLADFSGSGGAAVGQRGIAGLGGDEAVI